MYSISVRTARMPTARTPNLVYIPTLWTYTTLTLTQSLEIPNGQEGTGDTHPHPRKDMEPRIAHTLEQND